MSKEAILKIENAERGCEKLLEKEKEKLRLKLKEVKRKSDEMLQSEREKNFEIYKKAVDEFKICVDKKTEEFKKRVEEQCNEMENKLKSNVSKAVELVLSKFLNQ